MVLGIFCFMALKSGNKAGLAESVKYNVKLNDNYKKQDSLDNSYTNIQDSISINNGTVKKKSKKCLNIF